MQTAIRTARRWEMFALWLLLGLTACALAQSAPATSPLSTATVLHNFTIQYFGTSNNIDGITFPAPLTLGSDGNFYGVAQTGGPNGTGTVFKVTRTGVLTVLLTFASGNVNSTGATPSGSLIEDPGALGTFYGTTQSGGDNASGTLFKLVTTGAVTETILHSFGDSATPNDGIIPAGALALRGGVLYGTTAGGGAHGNAGTVYQINTSGSGYAILHSFTSATDGSNPRGLVLGTTLSGVVQFGGPNGAGTVWNMATDGTGFKTLYTFGGADGYSKPTLSLALAGDGTLYGSFGVGTPSGYGGIYKIDPQGTFSVLHAFVYDFNSGTFEGGWPGSVALGADGNVYGQLGQVPFNTPSTQFNPSYDHRFFQVRASDGALTLLSVSNTKTFQGYGTTALTAAPDGTLYDLENSAGASGYGDVIQLRPAPNHILTVSSTADGVNSINDPTTLRGAINAAQPGDSIVFSAALQGAQSTITLTQGALFISQDLNIVYTSTQDSETGVSGSLTIDAGGQSRVFHISGGVVNVSGLTLTNGFVQGQLTTEISADIPTDIPARPLTQPGPETQNTTQGGGVLIDGSAAVGMSGVTITNCSVTGSSTVEGGGLCLASGNLTFASGTITNCSASVGGGMAVDTGQFIDGSPLPGGVLLNFATLDANTAMEGGGLAILYSGPVGMFFGTVTHNQAGDSGGGVYDVGGKTVIDNTTLANDVANGVTIQAGGLSPFVSSGSGAGGGLYNAGGFENLDNDVFSGDTAYSGGALDVATDPTAGTGDTKIYFTTFSGNMAVLSTNGPNSPGPLNGDGGAITVDGGTLNILQSTVGGTASQNTAGNHADTDGGGIYIGSGTATINDITFYGNVAAGRGGAVFNSAAGSSDVTLYYCTITNNDATLGGGLYEDFNVNSDGNPFTVYSAIVAQNTLGGSSATATGQDAAVTAGGTFTSSGSNLIGNGDGANGLNDGTNHDQVGGIEGGPVLDPLLFPLGNYGGTTLTRALKPGSPALQMSFNIDNDLNKFDQRGVQRPYPNPYDIGAAEHPAPHALNDSYSTTENTALVTPASGVLSNDYADLGEQPNPYPLTAVGATQPANGMVTLATDGSFTYTPNPGFVGTDTFTYQAFDTIADSVPATVTITVTGATPTTTAALSGTAGSNGYYRSAVTVTLSATDPTYAADTLTTTYSVDGGPPQTYHAPGNDGGPATGTGPFLVSGDGLHTVTFSSTDPAGGQETPAKSVTFKIDATPPTLTFGTPAPPPNINGYNNTTVSLSYTTTDATSGVASSTPGSPLQFTAEGRGQTQTVTVTDNAGNSATFTTPAVSIDRTAPVTTGAAQPMPSGSRVTLTATDNLSGVSKTAYSLDGGPTQPYTAPFSVSRNGPHTISFQSTDNAGNIESPQRLAFTVSVTGPHTAISLAGAKGTNGWYTGTVTATLTPTPGGLPIAATFYTLDSGPQQTYTGPFPVSGDGLHTVTYFSTDTGGNSEAPQAQTVKIQSSAPTTTAALSGPQAAPPTASATYTGPVTVTLTATDPLSGIAYTFYTLDGGPQQTYGRPFTVSGVGTHTLTFGSVNVAGNREAPHALAFTIVSAAPPSVLHTFPAGLQLFSVPHDMSGVPLGTALSQINPKLAVWSPTLVQYVLTSTPPADALRPGQGYWARFSQATNLYDLGTPTPTNQPFAIPIHRGWNMIGDPFPAPAPPGALSIQTSTGTFGLGDSVFKLLLSPTTYTYDSGAGAYQTHSLPQDALQPYAGYWLYSRCDGNLLVRPQ